MVSKHLLMQWSKIYAKTDVPKMYVNTDVLHNDDFMSCLASIRTQCMSVQLK